MRLFIADDHGVVRGGLRLLLDRQPDMEVVGEAADGRGHSSPVGTTPAASTISTAVRTGACVQCMTPRGTV